MNSVATVVLIGAAILGVVFLIWIADALLAYVVRNFIRGSVGVRLLLLIPLLVLFLVHIITSIFAVLCMVFTGYTAASAARNWWHKGGRR